MSELSKMIEALVKDLEQVLGVNPAEAQSDEDDGGEGWYLKDVEGWKEVTDQDLDRILQELTQDGGERNSTWYCRGRGRNQSETLAEQSQEAFRPREQVDSPREERVKPLAQALSQVEDMRVSISLADRERLVALLHSQTRLTDERVEDIACVLSDAQPVPTDLRPLLQDNLKALGKTLYWLRECLRDADDQFIRQHLSQGLELIQTQMGKTERAIEENKDEQ
jgi:hypothetical protein